MRYGIIGSGMMGHEHMRNIALLDGAEVVAVADPDEGMRDSCAASSAGGGYPRFADYRDLLAADICDAYVVATPNDLHVAVMRDARRAAASRSSARSRSAPRVADCSEITQLAEGRRRRRSGWRWNTATCRRCSGCSTRSRTATIGRLADDLDPRAPLSVPEEGRRLEPLQRPDRRHAGGEMLPFLRPDAAAR